MDHPREERRLVTCLFIDIVSSTELTIRLGPERLKRALGAAFKEIDRIVTAHGGTVEKYVGDAIYVLFGAPVAHPDDPERAVRAAWACLEVSRENADFLHFLVRLGIETGEAVVDLSAAELTRQQMSVGAVVNIAARLQQSAGPGQIFVGPTCHDATIDAARYEAMGEVDLKGIGQIPVWSLTSVHASPGRRRLPFVGRSAELELLEFAFRRSRSRSVLALVSGPPGQGKTRLVEELIASLDATTRIITARCRPTGEIGGLEPLQQLLGVSSAGDMDQLRELFPDADEWSRMRVALAHSAGLATNAALTSLAPDEREDELVNAWRRYISSLARRAPTVVWIEDVHWAEPLVVRLVDRLTTGADPLLVVATARPEFAQAAGMRPTGDRFFIELTGLEPEACLQLARSAGDADARALERAEGNPLFLVELARARSATDDLPLTLQGALGARLDELTPDDRALLACASVAGESFTLADAAALAGRDASEAHRTLARLTDLHYLQEAGDAYRFHHSLLRDVAYGRLLVVERRKLHARYARERARPGDAEVLAHHWWSAVGTSESEWAWEDAAELRAMRSEALSAHLEAAQRSTDHFATARAIDLLERVRAFAVSDTDAARLERALGDAYGRDVRGDESFDHYERAHAAYARAGNVPIQLLIDMLEIRRKWGGFRDPPSEDRVQPLFVEAEKLARAVGDRAGLARVLLLRSVHDPNKRSSLALGGGATDAVLLHEAVRVAEESDDPAALRDGLGWLANHLIAEGDMAGATAALDRAVAVSGDAPRTVRQEQLLGRCQIAYWSGKIDEGRRVAEQAVALSQPMGPHLRTHASTWVSQFALSRGDWPAVEDLGAQTMRLVDANTGSQFCAAAAGAVFRAAMAHALAGRADEARALTRTVERLGRSATATFPLHSAVVLAMLGSRNVEVVPQPATESEYLGLLRLALAVFVGRWEIVAEGITRLRAFGARDASFARAVAEAAEEELRMAAENGPAPGHAGLKALGCVGWSELLARGRALRA